MVSFAPATHKLVTAADRDLSTAAPVDGRVALARLLQVAGVADIQFGESAPGDNTKLWYKGSTNVLSRYNPITGAWAALTEAQFSLWLQKRAQGAADSVATLAAADTFLLHRNATGEAAKINAENLKAALGLGVGQIVAYWIGYVDGGDNVTEIAAKNLILNSPTRVGSAIKLKPTLAIPQAYYHSTGVGNSNVLYLGNWTINTEKQLSFNGSSSAPGVVLVGALS